MEFAKRILWQSYTFDWLGNMSKTGDDAEGFYDRSLGNITNGEDGGPGAERAKPYQLKEAGLTTSSNDTSKLKAYYDDAGYMTRLLVERAGTCLPSGSNCNQWYEYQWDIQGRLSRARRWDGQQLDLTCMPGPGCAPVDDTTAVPTEAPAAEMLYRYDSAGSRMLKTAVDHTDPGDPQERHTVYLFASLELRRAQYNEFENDYDISDMTEVPYLIANGVRLARVHYEPVMDPGIGTPTQGQGELRVFFELGDHLGSTNAVLDKETSELVERGTYQAFGAAESDYRNERWKNFRADYRFTGKEEDVQVGLMYFGFRYLNVYLQRWVSADPASTHELDADPNSYAYVSATALKSIDPLGLQEKTPTTLFNEAVSNHHNELRYLGLRTGYITAIMDKSRMGGLVSEKESFRGGHAQQQDHTGRITRHIFFFTRRDLEQSGYVPTITHEFSHALVGEIFSERESRWHLYHMQELQLRDGTRVKDLNRGKATFRGGQRLPGQLQVLNEVAGYYIESAMGTVVDTIKQLKQVDAASSDYEAKLAAIGRSYDSRLRAARENAGLGWGELKPGQAVAGPLQRRLDHIMSAYMIGIEQSDSKRLPTFGELKQHTGHANLDQEKTQ